MTDPVAPRFPTTPTGRARITATSTRTEPSVLRLAVSLAAIVCLCRPASATAQMVSDTTGALGGRATDATGAALPGVAVSLSSNGLITPIAATTDDRGVYRFPALPPASYTVVFSRAGFRTETYPAVVILLGKTASLDPILSPSAFAASVTVTASPPLLDRRSTNLGVTFDHPQLTSSPGSRGIGQILSATPSIQMARMDVGGSNVLSPATTAYGTVGRTRAVLEGIVISGFQTFGLTLDFGSFHEAAVSAGAFSADANVGPGMLIQFITPSGGNQYHGTFYGDVEPRHWQAFNITASQLARAGTGRGAPPSRDDNRLAGYHDLNADVAGFVVKGRSWWYASARDQEVATRLVTFPDLHRMRFNNFSAKSTTRLGGGSQLVAFAGVTRTAQPTRLDAFHPLVTAPIHLSAASTSDHHASGEFAKIEWRSMLGRQHVIEARAAWFSARRRDRPRSAEPRREDSSTLFVEGGTRDWRDETSRPQLLVTATSFLKGRAGEHQLKFGGEAYQFFERESWFSAFGNGVLHELRDGQPNSVRQFSTPSRSEAGMWWYVAFATDSWKIADGLSATIGVRADRFRLFLPGQAPPPSITTVPDFPAIDNLISWTVVTPRIGVAARVTPDDRTLAKFSYASYPLVPGADLAFNASENSNVWWTQHPWTRDDDGNRLWSPGEEDPVQQSRGGVALEGRDPNLKLPITREVAAWLERELPGAVVARSGIVWRGDRDLFMRQDTTRDFSSYTVPMVVPDPGPDGIPQTGDDGPAITVYRVPANQAPGPNEVRNVPGAATSALTWEANVMRRHVGRWAVIGGVSYSWNRDHASGYLGQNVRQNALALTPNDFLFTDTEGRHVFTTWTARLQFTADIGWGLRSTAFVRHQSGHPFGRTLSIGGSDPGVILTEPIGSRRMDHLTLTDVRIERTFGVSRARTTVFVDAYNLFNANPEQSASWRSGAGQTFLRPIAIVPPRIAKIGVRLVW